MAGNSQPVAHPHARLHLAVSGIVQGVGFRPYIYGLATRHALAGFVLNGPAGVEIEVEGSPAAIEAFAAALPAEAPPLVQIRSLTRTTMAPCGETVFLIRTSAPAPDAFTLVPPDIATCDACLAEVHNPSDRRFAYPFTNCTNCGPRYSIIEDIPYDRASTTMREFTMCSACQREYEDPVDRRFHAQPNACPVCGPHLTLSGKGIAAQPRTTLDVLTAVAEIIERGGIVAWKGLGGYQLACDARNTAAVTELRRRKRRSEKPFAVMVADADAAAALCNLSAAERSALTSRERPIVLLRRRADSGLAPELSPGNPFTGLMLPCTPMHDLLFRVMGERTGITPALVMTSGNISEEPIVIDNAEAELRLAPIADAFVHHNRRIHTRVDDSVVRVFDSQTPGFAGQVLAQRRARGYAPQPVYLGLGTAQVLATGAELKSAFCLTRNGYALLSQHLGDLENIETLEFFEQTLERMEQLFHCLPDVVAHDLHPRYLSTQFALRLPVSRRIGVQHHHAHIASCMAEHHLTGNVIGVSWDGTGFGTDGCIWGGEFLLSSLSAFTRAAHLRYVPLAGGDAAVREPWRMARSYLRDAFGDEIPAHLSAPVGVTAQNLSLFDQVLARNLNSIPTSSAGRLFDAVASISGLRHTVSFEGQAAMELEFAADPAESAHYDFAITTSDPIQIDLRAAIRAIAADLARHASPAVISARLHNTLTAVIVEVCSRLRVHTGESRVCLSGGCFQNQRLLASAVHALARANFSVFHQRIVPANDGGIALGQAASACEIIRTGA